MFFALSLMAHILILLFARFDTPALNAAELSPNQSQVIPLKVQTLTPAEIAELEARQVIEVPPGPEQQPEHAKYLAERAMKAARDIMARPGASFAGHAAPPVPSQDLFQAGSSPGSQPSSGESKNGKEAGMRERLKLTPIEAAELFGNNPGAGYPSPGRGHGGGIDFLAGAAIGDVTIANAYKYKYAGFFNQLKRSIAFYWNPEPALYLVPAASGELATRVRFILRQDGALADMEVLSSSQYQSVDRAALAAIKNATPVFGVPDELLDDNNQVPIICEFRILLGQR